MICRLFILTLQTNIKLIMENQTTNKYIAVAYKLYASGEKEPQFIEEATDEKPFDFITGFGIALEEFENHIINLNKGEEFDFSLTKDQAYGDYEEERVVDLDRNIFCINGHFDHENVFVDAVLPLQNEDGQRFFGKVLEITEKQVKIDLNHPLAGKNLNFKGHVVETRDATNEEIQYIVNQLSGEGCGCDDCHNDCGHDHHHGDGCGCGHCHH